jgi:hypothetical protein
MKFMQWQATDQFGNLYVGSTDANCVDDILPDIESLIQELKARVGDSFQVTVDSSYGEISGPDPGKVTHMLRSTWISDASEEDIERLQLAIDTICADNGVARM